MFTYSYFKACKYIKEFFGGGFATALFLAVLPCSLIMDLSIPIMLLAVTANIIK